MRRARSGRAFLPLVLARPGVLVLGYFSFFLTCYRDAANNFDGGRSGPTWRRPGRRACSP